MTDLESTLLTETIRRLHHDLWSGVVAVSSGDLTKGLYFRRGRFVFAASTVEDDKLGEFLVRTGRISRKQFAAALEAAQAPGKRLGQALVEIGAVNDLDLEDLVAEQLHMIALSAFRWTAGTALTEDVEEPIPADLALPLSTERLLLEGARTYPDPRRLEQALGDLDRRVQRAENVRPAFNYRRVSESRAEKTVLAALRAPKKIADLLTLPGPSPRPALVRALYALFVSGLLENAASETPAAGIMAVSPPPLDPAPAPGLPDATAAAEAKVALTAPALAAGPVSGTRARPFVRHRRCPTLPCPRGPERSPPTSRRKRAHCSRGASARGPWPCCATRPSATPRPAAAGGCSRCWWPIRSRACLPRSSS